MTLFVDIETTQIKRGSLPEKIHCICVAEDKGKAKEVTLKTFQRLCRIHKRVVAHNGHGFDFEVLRRHGIDFSRNELWDTIIQARIGVPFLREIDDFELKKMNGSQSLEAWGIRLGFPKQDYTGGWDKKTPEMVKYCLNDVKVLQKLYYESKKFPFFQKKIIKRENRVQQILSDIQHRGLVLEGIDDLINEVNSEREKSIKKIRKFGFDGNLNSRQQVAAFLISKGWKPAQFTEKTNQPKVLADTLSKENEIESEFRKYYLCQKPLSQAKGIKKLIVNNKIFPQIITSGARTGRCVHRNPNVGQIPAIIDSDEPEWEKGWGKSFRSLFVPEKGHIMVGSDLKSQEAMILGALIYQETGETQFLDIVQNSDIHTVNSENTGIPRNKVKNCFFAMLYGAGDYKLGITAYPNLKNNFSLAKFEGEVIRDKMVSGIKGFRETINRYQSQVEQSRTVTLMTGRNLFCESPHAALNTAVQGLAAEQAKFWLLNVDNEIKKKNIDAKLMLFVHDELQFSTSEPKKLEKALNKSVHKTGKQMNLPYKPLCDIKIGKNWSETH